MWSLSIVRDIPVVHNMDMSIPLTIRKVTLLLEATTSVGITVLQATQMLQQIHHRTTGTLANIFKILPFSC